MRGGLSREETPYAVVCPDHGQVFLTESEYNRQMGNPDRFWACPHAGPRCYPVAFDDLHYESRLEYGVAEEEPAF